MLAAGAAWADGGHRGEAIPLQNTAGGKPAVGLTYLYDEAWGWSLTLASRLGGDRLAALPASLYWTLATPEGRSATGVYHPFTREGLVVGNFRTEDPGEVRAILAFPQSGLDLVVTTDPQGTRAVFYLSLGDLCARFPSHVKDLSHSGDPACVARLDP